ncbi:MAG: DUF2490 domain-containing protein [Pseudomonadota bacterium]
MSGGLTRIGVTALALCAAACPALAQEEDTQLWVYAVAKTDLADDTSLAIDFTARWREERRGGEQQTARFTVLHEVTDGVRLGGGGGVFETEGGRTEIRPHQEIDLKFGRISARTRVEQRFFDRADRMEVRVRQLVRYTLPFGDDVKLAVDGEYLGIARSRDERRGRPRNRLRPRNQLRARAILSAKVSDRLTLGGGYMAIYTPREGRRDRLTHVPEAYITLKF